jgi:chromosome segregation ATPase
VNKAVVKIARDALLARGLRPTVDAVRIELGNTGSKSTIHRCLKELAERIPPHNAPGEDDVIITLAHQMGDHLRENAQAAVAAERETLTRQQLEFRLQRQQCEERIQDLQGIVAALTEQVQAQRQLELTLQNRMTDSEMERSRLQEVEQSLRAQLEKSALQVQSLEEKHLRARQALEHYRQSQQDQRAQELRRHDEELQQLRREIRSLQQSLIGKQDELTTLNRDNERLLSDVRAQQQQQRQWERELIAQRQQFQETSSALSTDLATARALLTSSQTENATLRERLKRHVGEYRQCRRQIHRQEKQLHQLQAISPTMSPPSPPAG